MEACLRTNAIVTSSTLGCGHFPPEVTASECLRAIREAGQGQLVRTNVPVFEKSDGGGEKWRVCKIVMLGRGAYSPDLRQRSCTGDFW